MTVNIIAAGAYWPRFVVTRQASSLRICSHDEDAITLAVEAGLAALEVSDTPPEKLDGLYLALGASPLAEGPVEQIVSNALGLKASIATATFSGSEPASLTALFSAGDAVGSGRLRNVLVIASEGGGSPRGELPGAAATALLVSDNGADPIAIIESFQRDGDVAFHRWRQNPADGSQVSDYRFLKKYFTEHATRVLDGLENDMRTVRFAVFTGAPIKAVREVLQNAFKGDIAATPHSVDPGNFGVAGPFLSLLTGLEAVAPGERFLAVSHGSGQTVAMSLLAGKPKATRVKPPSKDAQSVSKDEDNLIPANPKLPLPAMSPFFWKQGCAFET
jgi:3-hydroxy-3-methylglutaryl CoA synthase